VAGVNSDALQIAFSDPFFDNAEMGGAGIIGNGQIIEHIPGQHDATVHNDEGNVSHDIYHVIEPSPSPGGVWMMPDYPVSLNPGYCYDFDSLNIPDEFLPMSKPWNGVSPIFTEVEYAVHISPWDYLGDVIQSVPIPLPSLLSTGQLLRGIRWKWAGRLFPGMTSYSI